MIQAASNLQEKTLKLFDAQIVKVGTFLDKNPSTYKTVMVANHLFRAFTMFAAMEMLPFSAPVSCGIMILPSLLYRSSVERFCVFRFTLPALAGGAALMAGRAAAISLLAGAAFRSVGSFFLAILGGGSLAAYMLLICHLSKVEVGGYLQSLKPKRCCH